MVANNTKVYIVTPCARVSGGANSVGLSLSDYADIEKQIGESKGVSVIDLYTMTNNSYFKAQLPDGLHPNEIGHQIIANCILSSL